MMKKLIIVLFLVSLSVFLLAQDSNPLSPRLQERFEISENNELQFVSEKINISLDSLKTHFKLNLRDASINRKSLKSLGINVNNVYQFYNLHTFGYDDSYSLESICLLKNIPFKKMSEYLNLDPQDVNNRSRTLRDLGVEALDIEDMEKRFKDERIDFSSTLTVLGMSVVFVSLILTSLLISQLVHLNRKNEKKESKPTHISSPVGTITTKYPENLSSDAVVAVIAAIHKHKQETDEENRIMLTWRRANISMWHASGKVEMPNSVFKAIKKSR